MRVFLFGRTTQNNGNMHHRKFVNLMGVDGVTEKTGESSRPADAYFEKGPNLRDEGGIYGIDNP
jgi:hypothetical protein